MANKKNLKKGKKLRCQYGGAKIKISGEQIRKIVKNIFDNSIFVGKTITNVIIANAIFEVLGGVMAGDELTQLSNLGINIIAVSLQFILTSLKLTLGIGSKVGSQLISASSFVTNSLWSAVTSISSSISNICSSNPTASTVVVTAATTTLAFKNQEIKNIIQNVGDYGLIDSVSIMLFDLLIKSGLFEDAEGYNQLKIEDLKDNQVNDIVEQLVTVSRNNTPENSPISSQDSELALIEDIGGPQYDEEAREQLALLLNNTLETINNISENYRNYEELSDAFSDDAETYLEDEKFYKICQKRKNVQEQVFEDENPSNIKASKYDKEESPILGGKKTIHRKITHIKHKTKKYRKTHTKKHNKKQRKQRKYTKKH